MGELVIFALLVEGAIVVFDRFGGFAIGIVAKEGDLMTVGAPGEGVYVVIFFCQRKSFSTFGGNQVELRSIAAVAEESDPLAVGAPFWRVATAFWVVDQLKRGLALAGKPDLGVIGVLFPICRRDSIGYTGAIWGQDGRAGLTNAQPFFEWDGRLARQG